MIRTFHSIGQGAFYTEEFGNENKEDEFTVVYDCGTYSSKKLVTDAIDKLGKERVIDILFISHFHQDHISGLEHLLRNCNVKNIFIPLLHDEEKILVSLTNKSKFHKSLTLDPKGTITSISKSTNVIFVEPDGFEPNNDAVEIDNIHSSISSIKSGSPLRSRVNDWEYVPFNFSHKKRSPLLIKKLMKLVNPFNAHNFKKEYLSSPNKKNAIDNLYLKSKYGNKITGDENTNSLVVYSGKTISNDLAMIAKQTYHNVDLGLSSRTGCIFMGDYDAKGTRKFNEFEIAFMKFFNEVGTIQIPHHGSTHNFREDLLDFADGIYSVISARKGNKHHPAPSTLKSILLKKGIPVLVTEESDTEFIQVIE